MSVRIGFEFGVKAFLIAIVIIIILSVLIPMFIQPEDTEEMQRLKNDMANINQRISGKKRIADA